jgi:hypothetical protein
VAVANSGTGNRVMTSPDGVTWTAQTTPADNNWLSVTWADALGLLVAVANTGTGNRVMTSPNGVIWTVRTTPADSSWQQVIWADTLGLGLLVAVGIGTETTAVMTSGSEH